jgi:hypothetical protein
VFIPLHLQTFLGAAKPLPLNCSEYYHSYIVVIVAAVIQRRCSHENTRYCELPYWKTSQFSIIKSMFLTQLQDDEDIGSSDDDCWIANTSSRHKKKKAIREKEEEPDEDMEPDMETLSAVIKLEVQNFYYELFMNCIK